MWVCVWCMCVHLLQYKCYYSMHVAARVKQCHMLCLSVKTILWNVSSWLAWDLQTSYSILTVYIYTMSFYTWYSSFLPLLIFSTLAPPFLESHVVQLACDVTFLTDMTCQCQHPWSQTLYVMCSAGMYMYLHKHRACTPGTSLIPMLHHGMGMGLAGQVELLLNHMWYYQVTGNCSGDERIRSIDESTIHDE